MIPCNESNFAQSTAPFDPDALELVGPVDLRTSQLRYRNPATGQTWLVPTMWYTIGRLRRISKAEWDIERCHERKVQLLRDHRSTHHDLCRVERQVVCAEYQILVMRDQLALIQSNLDEFRRPTNPRELVEWDHALAPITNVYLDLADSIGERPNAAAMKKWLEEQLMCWRDEAGITAEVLTRSQMDVHYKWLSRTDSVKHNIGVAAPARQLGGLKP